MTSKATWAAPEALPHLIAFGYKLTEALDDERNSTLSVGDAEQSIREGTVFPFLERNLGQSVDLSMFDANARRNLTAALAERAGLEQEDRQYNIDRNGLCTLLALTFSAIGYVSSKYRPSDIRR